jgi:alanyl-tRNA synthetase
VEFVCGGRSLRSYRAWREAATSAARLLSVGPGELGPSVARLQQESKDLRRNTKVLAEKAARLEAGTLDERAVAIGGITVFVGVVADYDAATAKLLATAYVKDASRAIVAVTAAVPAQVIAMRSRDAVHVNCAAIVSHLENRFGGRGGGKPESAQGTVTAAPERVADAARDLLRSWLLADEGLTITDPGAQLPEPEA